METTGVNSNASSPKIKHGGLEEFPELKPGEKRCSQCGGIIPLMPNYIGPKYWRVGNSILCNECWGFHKENPCRKENLKLFLLEIQRIRKHFQDQTDSISTAELLVKMDIDKED